ncbi:MAG TPA: DUF4340 domain-containing protein [Rhodocyclaceae bacterium]|nr:DUF4340 domain-containing protein [Rhodocyclaceae bacterium]
MNRPIVILSSILAAQIVLGAVLNFGIGHTTQVANGPVLTLPHDKIDGIEISSKDQTAKLVLRDGAWHLPDYYDLPASADGVKVLLDHFDKLDNNAPIATTSDARKRFKVDASDFERRVVFRQGGKILATVYVGTNGSRNRSMLRVEGNDAIREEPIANYELQTDPAQWTDKSILHIPAASIAGMDVAGLHLTYASSGGAQSAPSPASKGAAQWTATGVPAGHTFDPAAAAKLAGMVSNLDFEAVLGTDAKPEYGLAQPLADIRVARQGGSQREYRIGKSEKEDWYALQVSDRKEIFKLLPFEATPLIDASKLEALTKTEGGTPPAPVAKKK